MTQEKLSPCPLPIVMNDLIEFFKENYNWTVQKFNSESKNNNIWAIHKMQTKDSFIFNTDIKELLYVDICAKSMELKISYLGEKSLEVYSTLFESDLKLEKIKETILNAYSEVKEIKQNYLNKVLN